MMLDESRLIKWKQWANDPAMKLTMETSPHYQEMVRRYQEIRIDPKLCTGPGSCFKCIKACSPRVFIFYPGLSRATGERIRPDQVRPYMPELCNRCGRCAEVCPQHAITIIPGSG